MKNKIAIVGYGDLGKQFYNFLKEDKNNEFIFFDDIAFKNDEPNSFPFIDYTHTDYKNYNFYIGLGYHHLQTKAALIQRLKSQYSIVPAFIHQSSFINSSATIGDGTFIYPMCNIDKDVEIGNGVLINNSVCISHNSTIRLGCYLSPGCVISGNVTIGENTFIGSGTIVANNVKIGKNVSIGIGSVVTKDLPDNCSAIGNPIRILDKKINLI
jgi:sugar O-acyltransferase (sialic acid O-acetyltransferase NeuD family)